MIISRRGSAYLIPVSPAASLWLFEFVCLGSQNELKVFDSSNRRFLEYSWILFISIVIHLDLFSQVTRVPCKVNKFVTAKKHVSDAKRGTAAWQSTLLVD